MSGTTHALFGAQSGPSPRFLRVLLQLYRQRGGSTARLQLCASLHGHLARPSPFAVLVWALPANANPA